MNQLLLNQQDYIADRFLIAESWVQETSKIALYKVHSWQRACALPPQQAHHQKEIRELINEAFFSFVPAGFVLSEEGFYFTETAN